MTVRAGSRLGPYEIIAAIGAGGMGEVFRARDTKLNREVAIKVLPAAFAQDHERVARFKREAQVLASLNHPNIATIYGIEEIASSPSSSRPRCNDEGGWLSRSGGCIGRAQHSRRDRGAGDGNGRRRGPL